METEGFYPQYKANNLQNLEALKWIAKTDVNYTFIGCPVVTEE